MFVDTIKVKDGLQHYMQYDKALFCYFECKSFILKRNVIFILYVNIWIVWIHIYKFREKVIFVFTESNTFTFMGLVYIFVGERFSLYLYSSF